MVKGAPGAVELVVEGRAVPISHPDKPFFAARGETKLDLARYYLAVGEAALQCVRDRPLVLKRYPDGAAGTSFFQKRVPERRPDWLQTVVVRFPSGRTAEELCPADLAHVLWAVNLGCIDLNPWAVVRGDLDHPDELRIDLDPQEGVSFDAVRQVTLLVGEALERHGMFGFPKTSGSRGMHVVVPIEPRHDFTEVRAAALALARQLEGEHPDLVTAEWWKEQRGARVFVDYNQNARDRTVASAYSVRANDEARVSCPLEWDEVPTVDPSRLTLATVPARLAERGDPFARLYDRRCDIGPLLELAASDAAAGRPDAPWPPHVPKQPGEPRRSPSSRQAPGAR